MEVRAGRRTDFSLGACEQHLLEATARAVQVIMDGRGTYTVGRKEGVGDRAFEYFTSVDIEAQEAIADYLAPLYPGHRYLAEEEGLSRPWQGRGPRIVIDALDGTDHYMARNYSGACSMAAMVDGQDLSACIRNLDGSAYSCGPGARHVHYTFEDERRPIFTPMGRNGTILLRRPLDAYLPVTQRLVERSEGYDVTNISLGTWAQRLWRGECRACVLWRHSKHTPWDMTPIYIISRRLGYTFLRSTCDGAAFVEFDPELPIETTVRGYDLAIIHKSDLGLVNHLLQR